MKDQGEISYCAIAIVPEEPAFSDIVMTSEVLGSRYASWYVLSREEFPAHITLWIAYIPTRNLSTLKARFEVLLEGKERIPLRLEEMHVDDSGFVACRVGDQAVCLEKHREYLSALNDLRDSYIDPKYADRLGSYPAEQQRNLRAYGTRFADNLFEAHATVGFVSRDVVPEVARELQSAVAYDFEGRRVILFRQKESGRSIEMLAEANLT